MQDDEDEAGDFLDLQDDETDGIFVPSLLVEEPALNSEMLEARFGGIFPLDSLEFIDGEDGDRIIQAAAPVTHATFVADYDRRRPAMLAAQELGPNLPGHATSSEVAARAAQYKAALIRFTALCAAESGG